MFLISRPLDLTACQDSWLRRLVMAMRGRFGGVVVLLGLVVRLVAVLQPLADLLVLLPALLDPLSPTLLAVLGLALGGPLRLALNRDGGIQGRNIGLVLPSPRAQSSTPPATQWSIPSGAHACRSEERNCLKTTFVVWVAISFNTRGKLVKKKRSGQKLDI